jgi:exosortase
VAFRWTVLGVGSLFVTASLLFLVQIYQAAFGTNAASTVGLGMTLLWLSVANISYVFGGQGVKHFGFAFAFLLIALPMPSAVHNLIVGGLQSQIAAVNVEILNLVGIPAQRMGSLIRLPNCTVGIDEACSGIRSLQSAMMATLFIGYLALQRKSLRAVLVLSGLGLALVGNLIRSFFLSCMANSQGLEALSRAHDTAGWSILAFTAVGVGVAAWLFSRLEKVARNETPTTAPETLKGVP